MKLTKAEKAAGVALLVGVPLAAALLVWPGYFGGWVLTFCNWIGVR